MSELCCHAASDGGPPKHGSCAVMLHLMGASKAWELCCHAASDGDPREQQRTGGPFFNALAPPPSLPCPKGRDGVRNSERTPPHPNLSFLMPNTICGWAAQECRCDGAVQGRGPPPIGISGGGGSERGSGTPNLYPDELDQPQIRSPRLMRQLKAASVYIIPLSACESCAAEFI